jgi:predicted DsbA family dithiol-disulfide isomerase
MTLIVYGSFNCPYSFLASRRVDCLAERGVADVRWRAVVHDPDVPPGGMPVSGELAEMFDRELGQIRTLLRSDESFPASRPTVQPNTTLAVAGYSVVAEDGANRLRGALFDAFWVKGLDIGDADVLHELGCPAVSSTATAERWRDEWLRLERPSVPMAVLPDGTVSRGLGVLKRLATLGLDERADT